MRPPTHTSLHATSAVSPVPPNTECSFRPVRHWAAFSSRLKGFLSRWKGHTRHAWQHACLFTAMQNVSPLVLFCHLMVTLTGAPLRARHSSVSQRQGISVNCPHRTFCNTCPSYYLRAIVCGTNPFSPLLVPCCCWELGGGGRRGELTRDSQLSVWKLSAFVHVLISLLKWHLRIIVCFFFDTDGI